MRRVAAVDVPALTNLAETTDPARPVHRRCRPELGGLRADCGVVSVCPARHRLVAEFVLRFRRFDEDMLRMVVGSRRACRGTGATWRLG
jgi:hypothetical protein